MKCDFFASDLGRIIQASPMTRVKLRSASRPVRGIPHAPFGTLFCFFCWKSSSRDGMDMYLTWMRATAAAFGVGSKLMPETESTSKVGHRKVIQRCILFSAAFPQAERRPQFSQLFHPSPSRKPGIFVLRPFTLQTPNYSLI